MIIFVICLMLSIPLDDFRRSQGKKLTGGYDCYANDDFALLNFKMNAIKERCSGDGAVYDCVVNITKNRGASCELDPLIKQMREWEKIIAQMDQDMLDTLESGRKAIEEMEKKRAGDITPPTFDDHRVHWEANISWAMFNATDEDFYASRNGSCILAGDCSVNMGLKGCSRTLDGCNYICCSKSNILGCSETLMACYRSVVYCANVSECAYAELWKYDGGDDVNA